MSWRRLTRAEADAEARAEYWAQCVANRELCERLQRLFEEDRARSDAALAATRPLLAEMSSAELLDAIHAGLVECSQPLPCDDTDVLAAVLIEVERRRAATGHERIRLRELDRK